MRPNFLVIGAAKSGTTALYDHLARHPEIFVSRVKEPHFLAFHPDIPQVVLQDGSLIKISENVVSTPDRYARLFAESEDYRWRGECSNSTLYFHQRSIENIRRFCDENVRLIAVLRNPIDRAYSSFNHARRLGYEPESSFAEAIRHEAATLERGGPLVMRYADMSSYTRQLAPFFDEFGRDRVHVELYDDYRDDEEATVARVVRFLDLSPHDLGPLPAPVNASFVPTNKRALRVYKAFNGVSRRLDWIPAPWRRRVGHAARGVLLSAPPALPSEVRAVLVEKFRPEVEQLEDMLGRDLSPWLISDDSGRDPAATRG